MRAIEFLSEAKPQNLGQGMIDKLFAVYQQRDINDATLPQKFESGVQVADLIYQNVGPNYLIWVSKQYTVDRYFFLHDLPEWKTTLDQFAVLSKDKRIEIEKDINRYQNINQLRAALDAASGAKEQLGSKFYSTAIAAIDEFVKQGRATWLYRSNEYSIYHPTTFESSNLCKTLMSTSVCTIMNKDHFDRYSKYGTLIYTITQDKLFNCYISKNDNQKESEFADEKNNHDFDLEWQIQNFPALKPIIKKATKPNTELHVRLLSVNSKEEKYKMCKSAVSKGYGLYDVPVELRDYDLCKLAVTRNGRALDHVPEELRDYEICKIAVTKSYALHYVPVELRDYDLCKLAVTHNGYALQYVPKELRDYTICKIAVTDDSDAIKFVPEDLRDKVLGTVNLK